MTKAVALRRSGLTSTEVTVIEASLILSVMVAGGPDKAAVARDTVYAAVMIICNGVIGLCILVGGIRHREQTFRIEGMSPAYAALVTLATLNDFTLIFALTGGGPGNASQVLSTYMYQQGFVNYQIAYGTAVSVILLLVGVVLSIVYVRALRRS